MRPYLWMLLGATAFAGMSELAYALRERCDWQVVALARSSLALVFSAVLAWSAGARLVFWRPASLWLRSLAGSTSLVCNFYALTHLPVSEVLTLSNMFPLWVALLSWPMLGEPPSRDVWPAVVCGLVGVVLIQQPHIVAGGSLATCAAIVGSFGSALAMIGLHRLSHIDARAVVAHFSLVALAFSALAVVALPGEVSRAAARTAMWGDPWTWLGLLGVGATATAGQLCLTKAFTKGSPARVSVVALSQVGFCIVLDAWLWQRRFAPLTIAGIVLVMLPTAWMLARRPDEKLSPEC